MAEVRKQKNGRGSGEYSRWIAWNFSLKSVEDGG
jgi:hypothetical protein